MLLYNVPQHRLDWSSEQTAKRGALFACVTEPFHYIDAPEVQDFEGKVRLSGRD